MRFTIIGNNSNTGATVKIHYPGSETKQLYKDNKLIDYNVWVEQDKEYGPVQQ